MSTEWKQRKHFAALTAGRATLSRPDHRSLVAFSASDGSCVNMLASIYPEGDGAARRTFARRDILVRSGSSRCKMSVADRRVNGNWSRAACICIALLVDHLLKVARRHLGHLVEQDMVVRRSRSALYRNVCRQIPVE